MINNHFDLKKFPDTDYPYGYVYLLKDVEVSGRYKIGMTTNPQQRMGNFGVKLPFQTELIHLFYTDDCRRDERQLHERFANKRRGGEWFALNDSDVAYIKRLGVTLRDIQQPRRLRDGFFIFLGIATVVGIALVVGAAALLVTTLAQMFQAVTSGSASSNTVLSLVGGIALLAAGGWVLFVVINRGQRLRERFRKPNRKTSRKSSKKRRKKRKG